ncbi:hypothetical protein Q644_20540, partial [Brucella intermedia 229E]
ELSGGQRQRVWIAMVLAQETPILLLDEPTTFLDIAHQIELMDLLADLNRQGRTIVAVLHDLNHACRYASHLIAMKDGMIVAEGKPPSIVTEKLVEDVFGLPSVIIPDPVSNTPLIVPKGGREVLTGYHAMERSKSESGDFRMTRVQEVPHEFVLIVEPITASGTTLIDQSKQSAPLDSRKG